jgi:hypothetical protein
LPGTDRYVLKLHRSQIHKDYVSHKPPVVQSTSYTKTEIALEQLNVGQTVAFIDFDWRTMMIEICRRVWGQPFMWFNHEIFRQESLPAIYVSNVQAISTAANLPQSAYDYMALQIAAITNRGYSWEAHSENLMLTVGAKGLGLVDVEQYRGNTEIKTLSTMLNPFLELFPGIEAETAKPYKQRMIDKSIKAAARHRFNFLEDLNQLNIAALWQKLEQVQLTEWFLTYLQKQEESGNIPQGTHAHWKQLQQVYS